jgi:hypothetical protein
MSETPWPRWCLLGLRNARTSAGDSGWGRGNWLVRRLRQLDQSLAEQLLRAHRRAVGEGDTADLIAVAGSVLARAGGRLAEGFRVS